MDARGLHGRILSLGNSGYYNLESSTDGGVEYGNGNETTHSNGSYREVDVPRDIEEILVTGEVADRAFKLVRDVAVFTNKRLIVKDVQGPTGTKVEMYSLP